MVRHSVTSNSKRPLALVGLKGRLEGKMFLKPVSAKWGGCFACWLAVGTPLWPRILARTHRVGSNGHSVLSSHLLIPHKRARASGW